MRFTIARVPVTAVNRVLRMPMNRVTAKPRTGPLPKLNRITAAIRVVRFESRIVVKARSKPAWIAPCGELPSRSSSRR